MMYRLRFIVLMVMVLAAAASRLIPHPLNFAPIGAMALFGGASFTDRRAAFGVPLAAIFLSDMVIALLNGNYLLQSLALMPVIYGSFTIIVCIGMWLRSRRTLLPVAAATLAASVLFFVITNFADWALGPVYPGTWEGLVACYTAAIPFFKNTLLGGCVLHDGAVRQLDADRETDAGLARARLAACTCLMAIRFAAGYKLQA